MYLPPHVADLERKWIDDNAVLPIPSYRSWGSSDRYQVNTYMYFNFAILRLMIWGWGNFFKF